MTVGRYICLINLLVNKVVLCWCQPLTSPRKLAALFVPNYKGRL